jgi:hypothetical protein
MPSRINPGKKVSVKKPDSNHPPPEVEEDIVGEQQVSELEESKHEVTFQNLP